MARLRPGGKWIDSIDPQGDVCDAARQSLEARLLAVIHHLPLAAYHASQDTEHVHRLRVSTRRAMAALKLYSDWLPRKQAWVKKRLKKIRRTAGDARDLDVLVGRLTSEYGDRASALVALLTNQRNSVQPDLVRLAERCRRNDRFVRKTARLIKSVRPPESSPGSAQPVQFRDWAAEQLAQLVKAFFAVLPDENADMAALHQFRIRAKALRYAVELLASALEPEVRKNYYPILEQLQEHLGRINDRVTARDLLRAKAAEASDAAAANLFCELADDQFARLADELGEFRAWWSPEVAQQLSQVVTKT